jgi:DNA-binding MarR family transcriptional regulator
MCFEALRERVLVRGYHRASRGSFTLDPASTIDVTHAPRLRSTRSFQSCIVRRYSDRGYRGRSIKVDVRLDELGRLAEPAVHVLVSLTDGPKHGYAIMTDVETVSGESLGPGTLYAVLARLEQRGLIEPLAVDERRKPYRLTGSGAAALRAHLDGLERLVVTARRRMDVTAS